MFRSNNRMSSVNKSGVFDIFTVSQLGMSPPLSQNFTCEGVVYKPEWKDILKATLIGIITLVIVVGNIFSIIVFNNPISRKCFRKKVRMTMNSLICTDLSMGLFMCPVCIYSALYHCWPFGETFCKVEALLLSALFHESTLSLVLIALDRYFCVFHFAKYSTFMSTRKYIFAICSTWIVVFTTYAIVIFVGNQFYFDEIGINCEPYYENKTVTNLVIVLFYFLPSAVFVFCYGSIFFAASRRKSRFHELAIDSKHSVVTQTIKTSKYLAAISLGFFIAVSPWSICTMIIANTNIKLHEDLDFSVTWLAISNSFWNVVIYGIMNKRYRTAANVLTSHKKKFSRSHLNGNFILKRVDSCGTPNSSRRSSPKSPRNTPPNNRLGHLKHPNGASPRTLQRKIEDMKKDRFHIYEPSAKPHHIHYKGTQTLFHIF